MFRPLTKESIKQFQTQVLSHFQVSAEPEERTALLELAQCLENTIQAVVEKKKEPRSALNKDLSLADPIHAVSNLSKKGEMAYSEMAYSGDYERLSEALRKEAAR